MEQERRKQFRRNDDDEFHQKCDDCLLFRDRIKTAMEDGKEAKSIASASMREHSYFVTWKIFIFIIIASITILGGGFSVIWQQLSSINYQLRDVQSNQRVLQSQVSDLREEINEK